MVSRFSLEVKVAVTHHSYNPADEVLKPDKSLVFVMDPFKDPEEMDGNKKRKKNPAKFNIKNFGSCLNVSKVKSASRLKVAWRIRPGSK